MVIFENSKTTDTERVGAKSLELCVAEKQGNKFENENGARLARAKKSKSLGRKAPRRDFDFFALARQLLYSAQRCKGYTFSEVMKRHISRHRASLATAFCAFGTPHGPLSTHGVRFGDLAMCSQNVCSGPPSRWVRRLVPGPRARTRGGRCPEIR